MNCSTKVADIFNIAGDDVSEFFDPSMDFEPVKGLGGTAIGWIDRVSGLRFESNIAQHGEGFSGYIVTVKFDSRMICEVFLEDIDGARLESIGQYNIDYSQYRRSLENFKKSSGFPEEVRKYSDSDLLDITLKGAKACHFRFIREDHEAGQCKIVVMDFARSVNFNIVK